MPKVPQQKDKGSNMHKDTPYLIANLERYSVLGILIAPAVDMQVHVVKLTYGQEGMRALSGSCLITRILNNAYDLSQIERGIQ